MRWTQTLVVILIVLLVAACGGGGNGNGGDNGGDNGGESQPADDGGGDDGGGDDGGESQPADDGGGDDGGGDDGGQTGSFDLDHAFEVLTPPNATEISKTTAQGVIFAAWDTDESLDSLRSFYEDAIDELGLEILTTTEAQGGIAWVVAESEGSSTGGSISIFPASDGSGTQVSVTIGEES